MGTAAADRQLGRIALGRGGREPRRQAGGCVEAAQGTAKIHAEID